MVGFDLSLDVLLFRLNLDDVWKERCINAAVYFIAEEYWGELSKEEVCYRDERISDALLGCMLASPNVFERYEWYTVYRAYNELDD